MKIIHSIFFFMTGGVFTLFLINNNVIGSHQGNLSTEAEIAVYNLHDYLLDYVIFFVAASLALLFIILGSTLRAKYK